MDHEFNPLTHMCHCGVSAAAVFDGKAPSHNDAMHPGTVQRVYRQRSTGREITYRRPR